MRFAVPLLALLLPFSPDRSQAQIAPSSPPKIPAPKILVPKLAPVPAFKPAPVIIPKMQTFTMPAPAPMPKPVAAPVKPVPAPIQQAAAAPPPQKPTLSAPEPAVATVRNETLAGVNVLMAKAASASSNPSVARALATMKKEQLDWPTPPPAPSPDLADKLATAMKLAGPAQKLLPQLATFNNALNGPPAAQRQGALVLLKAAGKPAPKDTELQAMLSDALAAHNAASPDTQHGLKSAGNSTIAIDSTPSTGLQQVSVYQSGADGKPERVTMTGQEVSKPDAAGNKIETDLQADPPQIVNSKQSDDMRAKVNGLWTDQDGNVWEVAGQGDAITFTEQLKGGHKVGYVGKWKLGLPYASHLVNDMADMDNSLPDDVKQQLVDSYHPPFAVQLTYKPDTSVFDGVWISGEVTYSGMFHNVTVVNDPTWDKRLILSKKAVIAYYSGADESEHP